MSFFAYHVVIVGGGPAGATCAAFCAGAGLSVMLIERSTFPREKVCGDCVNPACWPVLERLDLDERVRTLPHAGLEQVEFVDSLGRSLACPLPRSPRGEIAVRRSAFDHLLLTRAIELGATVRQGAAVLSAARVTAAMRTESSGATPSRVWGRVSSEHVQTERFPPIEHSPEGPEPLPEWEITTDSETFHARYLVAADGRNSTVARLLGLLPAAARDRVGLQTHLALPPGTAGRVVMRFLSYGYCGLADVGDGNGNLCLVSRPADLPEIKEWAVRQFGMGDHQTWRSITPLRREAMPPSHDHLLLVGDAARVVEPFTGEGIYYALASGELAARHLIAGDLPGYAQAHARLYRGRLWVNQLARFACLHPSAATVLLRVARWVPPLLRLLTRKVAFPTGAQRGRATQLKGEAASG